ncbi:MAG: transporter [Flavobacterium sp. BFFFF1]|uniref:TolC family protein n=1 Tax=Flavobacterium sp. BFFFF1 TaxID=2015557 RepID=UPI000BCF88C9|nr:TolC family protein [Flavobacterium sp. BFFFF1]OYU80280.1 MAG: transporter [Flavobacterium sp. BFFFF1]
MRKLNLIITVLLFALSARGQDKAKESYAFSLEQAIAHALEHNYAAINANRDIDAAKQKKWETTASGLPQINAGVDYQNNFELQKSIVPAEFFGGAPGQFIEVAFGTKHTMNTHATLSQLIFDGSYIVALQASKTYLQYYQNAKQRSNTEIREMVTNAYGNVLLAEESIAVLQKNKSILTKTLNDTQETFKNGLIEEENVEQLQITLASVNSNLNNTTRLRDIAYNMLKIALGIDINDELQLTDKLDSLTVSNLDLALTGTEFNVNNNIDYLIAKNFTEQRQLEYKLQRSKALPTLSANVNFGYNAFNDQFGFFQKDQKWLNYSNLGVSLNVPIFSSFARSARTQQAKIAYEQSMTQLTEAEQQLKLQYERAKSEYEFSVEEFNTSKSNLNLAERIENKQQIKFTEGLSSSFDFSEAQRQLYTAQQNYLQSMVDVINKKAALEKITNNKK